jgi:hypothetical protein
MDGFSHSTDRECRHGSSVLTRDLPNSDAVRYLPRHHSQIADLDSMRELIKLRGKVFERVLSKPAADRCGLSGR